MLVYPVLIIPVNNYDFFFLHRSADPYLLVKVELLPSNGTWDAVTSIDIPKLSLPDLPRNNYSTKLPGIFKEKVGEEGSP